MVWQFIVNGLITGVLYTLFAIGFALVYNTTKIFNVAMAGVYVASSYMFIYLMSVFHLHIVASFLVAILVGMGLSLLTELLVFYPLQKRNASTNLLMVASIGLMIVITNIVAFRFGNDYTGVDGSYVPQLINNDTISVGNIVVSNLQVIQICVGVPFILLFYLLLQRTGIGVKLRAYSANADLFKLLGNDERKTRIFLFLASGFFVGLASCLSVIEIKINPSKGMPVLVSAFISVVIGGIGHYGGCALGGLLLGLLYAFSDYLFPTVWRDAVAPLVLLLFLFVMPQGILGVKKREF